MSEEHAPISDESAVRRQYDPGGDRSLSTVILEAVEAHERGDVTNFKLYDNIDPDALDHLFKEGAHGDLTVRFDFDDVEVSLWGDGRVEIRVTDQYVG